MSRSSLHRTRWLIVGVFAAIGLGACANLSIAKEEIGLPVGEKAPQFSLVDQNGKRHQLSELLKQDELLAVVFHRSAGW